MLLLTLTLLFAPPAHAGITCDKIRAEAADLKAATPRACDESRISHERFLASLEEVLDTCAKLEAQVAAGVPQLKPATENEMHQEIVSLRQKHMQDQQSFFERLNGTLLPTPLDYDPSRPVTPTVSSDCGTEVEGYARFRRAITRGFNVLFHSLERFEESLLQQAQERALPTPPSVPVKNKR